MDHVSLSGTPERYRAPLGPEAGDTADHPGLTAETSEHRAPSPAGLLEVGRHACREWKSVRLGDTSFEAGLPRDVTAGLGDGDARTDAHATGGRTFLHAGTEPTCSHERGAAIVVAADACLQVPGPDGLAPCSASTVQPAHAARHNPLGRAPADLGRFLARDPAPLFARRASERPRYAKPDTDALEFGSGRIVLALACRAELASDRDTLRSASYRTSVVDLRGSDFRQPHGSRQAVPAAQNDLLAREAEHVTGVAFTRARITRSARKEVFGRLAEAVRPMLSAKAAGGAGRREPGLQARRIGHLDEANSMLAPLGSAPVRTRLVDEPTPAGPLLGHGYRFEPVAEAAADRSLFLARTAHLTNLASRAEARFPRPESRGFRSSR